MSQLVPSSRSVKLALIRGTRCTPECKGVYVCEGASFIGRFFICRKVGAELGRTCYCPCSGVVLNLQAKQGRESRNLEASKPITSDFHHKVPYLSRRFHPISIPKVPLYRQTRICHCTVAAKLGTFLNHIRCGGDRLGPPQRKRAKI